MARSIHISTASAASYATAASSLHHPCKRPRSFPLTSRKFFVNLRYPLSNSAMTKVEIIITIIGVVGSLIAIGDVTLRLYRRYQKQPLSILMNELANKNTAIKKQRQILHKIQKVLVASGNVISNGYINSFNSNGRGKFNIFRDICTQNNIEPTRELCNQMLGSDDAQFRKEWSKKQDYVVETTIVEPWKEPDKPQSSSKVQIGSQVVYFSALLASQYPETCRRLTDILNRHNIPFAFLEGTKDIWCRDYMPVQTPSGKLIQFKYEPSYLNDSKYSGSRSDVKHVDKVNGISPIFSDINLDGGNVVMYGNKAIITDRVYSENPNMSREDIRKQLADILECQIIIIPALPKSYDFTGHADGMIRFVDEKTVIGNELSNDSPTFQNNMKRAMRLANLNYIEFPYFNYTIKGNNDHAIGVYLNYLEVGNLIIMPVFGVSGNRDDEALTKLKDVFPNKTIEPIDYNDVSLSGGILNCTTWVLTK